MNATVLRQTRDAERPAEAVLLAGISGAELDALLARSAVRRVRPGTLLFGEGGVPEGIIVVRSGAGEIFRAGPRGEEERVSEFEAGDVLAIASTLTGQRHLASARAMLRTEILLLSRWDARRACRRHPEIALRLHEQMDRRLNAMLRRMECLTRAI